MAREIANFGAARIVSENSSSVIIPGSVDLSTIVKSDRSTEYEDGVKKYRREKNLPDPFSNMSFAGVDINATLVIPDILEDRRNKFWWRYYRVGRTSNNIIFYSQRKLSS